MDQTNDVRDVRQALMRGLGRRAFLRAATVVGGIAGLSSVTPGAQAARAAGPAPGEVLQPGRGPIHGRHYLPSLPDQVRWGYVPATGSDPVLRISSGDTVTVDTVSHEGILEDQGRDPVTFFASHGVPRREVLDDAISIAAEYDRTARNFDVDGPHVVTGPIHVDGAEPGDVLKIEMLSFLPRVPYGVVSSRHGKGALARQADGSAPAGITLAEVMPPVATDGRATGIPTEYGNVFVFTPVESGPHGPAGVLPVPGGRSARFPLTPFMGMTGVAFAPSTSLTDPNLNSIPPTLGGGNIDINVLTQGSTFYLPVFAEGALFYTGDPHLAMGDGEVSLTAMEGSLRSTFRLTVCKPGSGDAPSVAFHYPFGESEDVWVPIGLSDPDAAQNGQVNDLNIAMRRAVVNALDFLQHDLGMDRAVAYAYLSAAADFHVSQVVDRTTGVHATIRKSHFPA
ncbi:MAG TPA: acetamidase/formamidase family protein [Pseudonocardiaceae bacterium]|nr:acetamidase/formamidase family protein [Pseudonocardiaceae bacterium]